MAYKRSEQINYWNNNYKNLLSQEPTYTQSDATTAAQNKLAELENNQPGEFQGTYADEINSKVKDYLNRNPFSYNANNDSTFQQYRDQYARAGKTAMQDTMGNSAALSGGYGNSYASVAGQQVYNNYMSELSDKIPELEDKAYSRYQDDNTQALQQISLLQNLDESEYGRYRDNVSDYFNFIDYYNTKYQNERNFDYSKFTTEWEQWNSKAQQANANYQYEDSMDEQQRQYDTTLAEQQRQFDAQMAYNYSNSSSPDDSSSSPSDIWLENVLNQYTKTAATNKASAASQLYSDLIYGVKQGFITNDERIEIIARQQNKSVEAVAHNLTPYTPGSGPKTIY